MILFESAKILFSEHMPIKRYGGNLASAGLKTVEIEANIPIYSDILAKNSPKRAFVSF